jgi:phage terminase large subunit GpA-like protein
LLHLSVRPRLYLFNNYFLETYMSFFSHINGGGISAVHPPGNEPRDMRTGRLLKDFTAHQLDVIYEHSPHLRELGIVPRDQYKHPEPEMRGTWNGPVIKRLKNGAENPENRGQTPPKPAETPEKQAETSPENRSQGVKTRERLSTWAERVICLPSGVASEPGRIKLHPYQRAICDAIGDPNIERISVLKSARIGFTTILIGGIAHFIVRDPSPQLVVLPTMSDCRDFMITDIESVFADSSEITDYLPMPHPGRSDRNTLTHRLYEGGSLKMVHAGAPRNFRRVSARVLYIDEIDACSQNMQEGDVTALAIQRTMTWPNRKLIFGGTPLDTQTSTIARLYNESNQQVWEVPCPSCGAFHELDWQAIRWPENRPEEAAWCCPSCEEHIPEKHKWQMTKQGIWTTKNPQAGRRHVGFKINSLSSMLPNAAWGKLAAEFLLSKDDPALHRVFVNTVLGLPYQEAGDEIDEDALKDRAEPFSLDDVPAEVLWLSAGIDMADDRAEVVICGWSKNECYVLAHEVVWSNDGIDDDFFWRQLDQLLRRTYKHPSGGSMKLDAVCIDGGDGGHLDLVSNFTKKRSGRRIMCTKGVGGFARPAI